MNEVPRFDRPQRHPIESRQPDTGEVAGSPAVRNDGRNYEASYDGVHFIPVPERLAKLMRIAMNVQKKLDVDPLSLERQFDTITREAEGLNCHKTILFARGDISYEHLTNTSTDEAEHGGHPEVIQLFNRHQENVTFFAGDIREYAAAHKDEFPFSVHVVIKNKKDEWTPAHSLIWLGEDEAGNEICFHKRGPYFENRFEFTTLKKVVDPYEAAASMFLIVPIEKDR